MTPQAKKHIEEAAEKYVEWCQDNMHAVHGIAKAYCIADFKAGAQAYDEYLVKAGVEFAVKNATLEYVRQLKEFPRRPLDPSFMFESGARWQHQQSAVQVSALREENERLRSQLEKAKNLLECIKIATKDEMTVLHIKKYFQSKAEKEG